MRTRTLLASLLTICFLSGCGAPLADLSHLAASSSIQTNAPVQAHVEAIINAPQAKVWALLTNVQTWPQWQPEIESTTSDGPLAPGVSFQWKTGGMKIRSQVAAFQPETELAWTGQAYTAKAVHVWKLSSLPDGQTRITVDESMDGLLMAQLFSSRKLEESDARWLAALKHAAESSASSGRASFERMGVECPVSRADSAALRSSCVHSSQMT